MADGDLAAMAIIPVGGLVRDGKLARRSRPCLSRNSRVTWTRFAARPRSRTPMTKTSILMCAASILALALAPLPASAGLVRIYITNAAGDSIHVIDPATNKVVQEIKNYVGAHGIDFSPDGSRIYVSNEETS